MKNKLKLLAITFCICKIAHGQTPANDPNWSTTSFQLFDDFNGPAGAAPDPSKWVTNLGWNDYVVSNKNFTFNHSQRASYVAQNGAGSLVLKAQQVTGDPIGKEIYAGAISSAKSPPITYTYGFYEIRCKLNSNSDQFMPAFWQFNGINCDCNNGNNNCGSGWYNENDYFETICIPNNFDVTSNVHKEEGNCTNLGNEITHNYISGTDLFNNFHTYGYEWSPERIIYYLDGVPYRYYNSTVVANHPMYLDVDLGFNGDTPNANAIGALPLASRQMTIDYIKIYNLNKDCGNNLTVSSPITNLSTFDFRLKNNITFAGFSGDITPAGSNSIFRASDFTVNGEFTVPLGTEVLLLPTICY